MQKTLNHTQNKTNATSQPSVLYFVEEEKDENAKNGPGKQRRMSSVQFMLPGKGKGDSKKGGSGDRVSSMVQPYAFARRTSTSIPENSACGSNRGDPESSQKSTCAAKPGSHNAQEPRVRSSGTSLAKDCSDGPSGANPQQIGASRTFTVVNYNEAPTLREHGACGQTLDTQGSTLEKDIGKMAEEVVDEEAGGEEEGEQKQEEEDDEASSVDGSVISSASRLQQIMALRAIHERYLAKGPPSHQSEPSSLHNDFSPDQSIRDKRRMSIPTQNLKTNSKRGGLFANRKKERLVKKDGDFNIHFRNISRKSQSYLADVFTTLLDMKWRYTFLIFVIAFVLSWLGFALIWWFISYMHGDTRTADRAWSNDTLPCVMGVYDFTSALLYSIETQHTIGYGGRAITPQCGEAVFFLMTQSIFGVVIQCVMAGVFLAKLARPKRRGQTIMFSRTAVICKEDGQDCLLFRLGDMRRSQLVGAMLHAMFVKKRITKEGDEIPFYQCHLDVTAESEEYDQFIFLSWPIRILHKIDENSPLWEMCAERLHTENFEIIVVLEGVVESTGMCMQARTSYLPSEIEWGHRLSPLVTKCNSQDGKYEIDYAHFHKTLPVAMPGDSAQTFQEQCGQPSSEAGRAQRSRQKRRLMSLSESLFGSHAPPDVMV